MQAFLIEMALDPAPPFPPTCLASAAWSGRLACTADDPLGIVRVAGTSEANATGILELLRLTWACPVQFTSVYARVETIGADHLTILSTAARFGRSIPPLPAVPHAPLVDLATAWRLRGDEALAACLILTLRLRVVESAMLYATDTELTLMLRFVDRTGVPDTSRTLAWIYIAPCPPSPVWDKVAELWGATYAGDGLWLEAPHYGDGWYGVQYRGDLPRQQLAVSVLHATLGPDLTRQDMRARVYGAIPFAGTSFGTALDRSAYALLELGVAPPACPWDARATAGVVLTWTVRVTGAAPYDLLEAARYVIGCNVSVPARRVLLQFSAMDDTLTISVGVESFLRAHDVAMAVSDPARLQAWLSEAGLNLTLNHASVRSLAARYENDPPDAAIACPKGYYYTDTGVFRQLPGHSTTTRDCYGFACDKGFVLDPRASICVPEYAADWVYWTVVCLVCSMALAVVLTSCAIRMLCIKGFWHRRPEPEPESEPEPEPIDNTLPIGVTENGELLFEAEIGSETSGSGSELDTLEMLQLDEFQSEPELEFPGT